MRGDFAHVAAFDFFRMWVVLGHFLPVGQIEPLVNHTVFHLGKKQSILSVGYVALW